MIKQVNSAGLLLSRPPWTMVNAYIWSIISMSDLELVAETSAPASSFPIFDLNNVLWIIPDT